MFYINSFRHSPGHEYYDPNDFLEGMHQEMEREELEYEVWIRITVYYDGAITFTKQPEEFLKQTS